MNTVVAVLFVFVPTVALIHHRAGDALVGHHIRGRSSIERVETKDVLKGDSGCDIRAHFVGKDSKCKAVAVTSRSNIELNNIVLVSVLVVLVLVLAILLVALVLSVITLVVFVA